MENINIYAKKLKEKYEESSRKIKEFEISNPRPALEYCKKHKEIAIVEYNVCYDENSDIASWEKYEIPCSKCREEEDRRFEVETNLLYAKIPKRYEEVDPSDRYMKSIQNEKGVLFIGGVGTGKTYELVALMKHLISEGKRVKFRTFGEICRQIRDAVGENQYNDLYDSYLKSEVFVIDDLGVENSTPFIKEFIYNLINDIYNNKKILLMTTNLTGAELLGNYTQRVVSRLNEMCDVEKLDGNDRRKSKL